MKDRVFSLVGKLIARVQGKISLSTDGLVMGFVDENLKLPVGLEKINPEGTTWGQETPPLIIMHRKIYYNPGPEIKAVMSSAGTADIFTLGGQVICM